MKWLRLGVIVILILVIGLFSIRAVSQDTIKEFPVVLTVLDGTRIIHVGIGDNYNLEGAYFVIEQGRNAHETYTITNASQVGIDFKCLVQTTWYANMSVTPDTFSLLPGENTTMEFTISVPYTVPPDIYNFAMIFYED